MKYSDDEYIVLRDSDTGDIIDMWPSMNKAAKALGTSGTTIANILNGRVKRSIKVHGILSREVFEETDSKDKFINLDGEEWKTVNGFDNYEISNCGRLRRKSDYKILNGNSGTYLTCCLVNDRIKCYTSIHRLVAEHFLPDWDPTLCVNHKDENKFNNHVSNLEMTTRSENFNYSRNLHIEEWVEKTKRTKNSSYSRAVRCVENGMVFDSISQASKASDINAYQISGCCRGKYLTAGGLHWEYVEEQANNN